MVTVHDESPYYDDYDPDKRYAQILAVPGRVEQARELTQMQTMFLDFLRRQAKVFLEDGDVVEGLELITESVGSDVEVTINPGRIYAEGLIHIFNDPQTVTLDGSGEEIIGLTLGEEIVTESEDASLRDPAQGYANFNQPGAHRVKVIPEFVTFKATNPDEDAIPVFRFVDGEQIAVSPPPEFDPITSVLARRTFDESANYLLRGLDIRIDATKETTDEIELVVEAGKAYVLGFEVIKSTPTRRKLQKSNDTREVRNEPHLHDINNSEIALTNKPVDALAPTPSEGAVTAQLWSDGAETSTDHVISITRGSPAGSTDDLEQKPVFSVVTVFDGSGADESFVPVYDHTDDAWPAGKARDGLSGSDPVINQPEAPQGGYFYPAPGDSAIIGGNTVNGPDTVYELNTDYIFSTDDISWSPSGAEPAVGATYFVVTWVTSDAQDGTNFDFVTEPDGTGKLDFAAIADSDRPVTNTSVFVDYTYYLARRDIVTIDKDGNLDFIEGEPDEPRDVKVRKSSSDVLSLAALSLPPFNPSLSVSTGEYSNKVQVNNLNLRRVTMNQIQKLVSRIADLENNQADRDLNKEAEAGLPPDTLSGVFSDGFLGLTKADTSFSSVPVALDDGDIIHVDDTSDVEHNVTFDLRGALITTKFERPDGDLVDIRPFINPTTSQNIEIFRSLITMGFTEVVLLEQTKVTEAFNINPYAVYGRNARITLDPQVDNWIDVVERQPLIQDVQLDERAVNIWHDVPSWVTDEEVQELRRQWRTIQQEEGLEWWQINQQRLTGTTRAVSLNNTRRVTEEAQTFIRTRDVEISGEVFEPNQGDFKALFDGEEVDLTPVGSTNAGSLSGSVETDGEGTFEAKFTIPPGHPTGVRTVEVFRADAPNDNVNRAEAPYRAEGFTRIVQDIVRRETIVIRGKDPLAQSFSFDFNVVITGITLYFMSADSSLPVTVQIRNIENGFPGPRAFGEKVVYPSDLSGSVSTNGSIGYKVEFDDPIPLNAFEEYCVVLLSESASYEVAVAKLGEIDLNTNEIVASQPLTIGVLFSSSNNSTWTAHQNIDMKFHLHGCEFDTSTDSILDFDELSLSSFTPAEFGDFVLAVDDLAPELTRVVWEYSVDGGETYIPSPPYEFIFRDQADAAIKIRARLITEDSRKKAGPVISMDSMLLDLRLHQLEGTYVSKLVQDLDAYSQVTQTIKVDTKGQSEAAVVYFSWDDGDHWIRAGSTNAGDSGLYTERTQTPVDEEYSEYKFKTIMRLPPPQPYPPSSPAVISVQEQTEGGGGGLDPNKTFKYALALEGGSPPEPTHVGGTDQVIEEDDSSNPLSTDTTGNGFQLSNLDQTFPSWAQDKATALRIYRAEAAGSDATSGFGPFELLATIPTTQAVYLDDGTDSVNASITIDPSASASTNESEFSSDNFRSRVDLKTANRALSPRARELANAMTVAIS